LKCFYAEICRTSVRVDDAEYERIPFLPLPISLACPRCGAVVALRNFMVGCQQCRNEGIAVNLVPVYGDDVLLHDQMEDAWRDQEQSLWRYRAFLPIVEGEKEISLGEGRTPHLLLRRFVHGFDGELWVKDETRNATWSHKDREMAVTVTRGRAWNVPVVVGDSPGNAGASLAAYAAAADLPCVIFASTSTNEALRAQMLAYGAYVLLLDSSEDRSSLIQQCIDCWGWYPGTNFTDPPVGSNPYGIEGYKTIAYEIFASCRAQMPDYIVVPTGYGDLITGIWRGLMDLHRLGFLMQIPRLVIAEAANSAFYTTACAQSSQEVSSTTLGKPTVAFSIGRAHGSTQALRAIYATDGFCIPVPEGEIAVGQLELAQCEGLYLETASVVAVIAGRQVLCERGGRVMVVATASGLKDFSRTLNTVENSIGHVPVVDPLLSSIQMTLKQVYRFNV
jgi:threonine synthase